MGCSHPGLDGAEGMFDRLAALAHLLRMLVEPALNGFENVLMFPSGDPSFIAGGASGLDCTALADVGPVAAASRTSAMWLTRTFTFVLPARSSPTTTRPRKTVCA